MHLLAWILAEFGDWSNAECEDLSYLKELKILPQNYSDDEFLAKTCEEHKNLVWVYFLEWIIKNHCTLQFNEAFFLHS